MTEPTPVAMQVSLVAMAAQVPVAMAATYFSLVVLLVWLLLVMVAMSSWAVVLETVPVLLA